MPDGKKTTKESKDRKEHKDKKDRKLRGRLSKPDSDDDTPPRRSRSKSPRDSGQAASISSVVPAHSPLLDSSTVAPLAGSTPASGRIAAYAPAPALPPSSNGSAPKTMDDFFSDMDKKLQANSSSILSGTKNFLEHHHETIVQPQFDAIFSQARDFERIQKEQGESIKLLSDSLSMVDKNMGSVNKPSLSLAGRDLDLYEHPPDLTLLHINTEKGDHVTLDSVTATMVSLLSEIHLSPDKFIVEGIAVDNKFVVRFQLATNPAAKAARNAIQLLRHPPPQDWRALFAASATDASSKVRLYINPDQSRRARREAGCTRDLYKITKGLSPASAVVTKRVPEIFCL